MLQNRRALNFLGFMACLAMFAFALYAEKVLHLQPCPLCMFERVGIVALGVTFLLAAAFHPRGRAGAGIWAALIALAALLPMVVAARHVWVQHQPAGSVPSCGATLDYLLEVFPLFEVVRKVMAGGGECARIDWTLLGLSMPVWVLIAAIGLLLLAVYAGRRNLPRDDIRFSR